MMDLSTAANLARTELYGLDDAELVHFHREGWIGAYPLLDRASAGALCQTAVDYGHRFAQGKAADGHFEERPWAKSMHVYLRNFQAVASQPAIVGRLVPLLGPDILAWGCTVTVRAPGETHRWHVDAETIRWPGISVFVGLHNMSRASSLKVIGGSHRLAQTPQRLDVQSDDAALAAARQRDPSCNLATVETAVGEFFIFDGRLWHGSCNTGDTTRLAMILQYARPDAEIRIPLNWNEPIQWSEFRPPCLLVSGRDEFQLNRYLVTEAPAGSGTTGTSPGERSSPP